MNESATSSDVPAGGAGFDRLGLLFLGVCFWGLGFRAQGSWFASTGLLLAAPAAPRWRQSHVAVGAFGGCRDWRWSLLAVASPLHPPPLTRRERVADGQQPLHVAPLLRLPAGAGQLERHPLDEQRAAVVASGVLFWGTRGGVGGKQRLCVLYLVSLAGFLVVHGAMHDWSGLPIRKEAGGLLLAFMGLLRGVGRVPRAAWMPALGGFTLAGSSAPKTPQIPFLTCRLGSTGVWKYHSTGDGGVGGQRRARRGWVAWVGARGSARKPLSNRPSKTNPCRHFPLTDCPPTKRPLQMPHPSKGPNPRKQPPPPPAGPLTRWEVREPPRLHVRKALGDDVDHL